MGDRHGLPAAAHVPPPILLAAMTGIQLVLTRRRRPTRRSTAAAAAIGVGSAALAASAVGALRRHDTTLTPEHPERTRHLVADGPFAWSRNPIYLALTGLLVAHAVLRRSLAALLPAIAFLVVIDRGQVPREERALQARFGKSYTRYRRQVPRWIGTPEG